jgi:hypothetical protein
MKSPIPPGFKASCVRGCLFVGIHTAGLAFWKRKLVPLPCKVSIIFKLLVPHNADLSRKGTACYYCIWLFFAHCRKILERVRTRAKSMSYQQKKMPVRTDGAQRDRARPAASWCNTGEQSYSYSIGVPTTAII